LFQAEADSSAGADSTGTGFPKRNVPGDTVRLNASMTEDFNPDPTSGGGQAGPAHALPDALERLIRSRPPDGLRLKAIRTSAGGSTHTFALSAEQPEPCPEPGSWALLLGDEVGPAEQPGMNRLLAHAAACGPCAQRLRILAAASSPAETAELAYLASSGPSAQDRLAAALARTPHQPAHKAAVRVYLGMGAGLAASLLIALGLTTWWRLANNPERLLAQAYASSRSFDLRMPGAEFAEVAPPTHLRGASTAREPSKLLEARAGIEKRLEAAPDDAHWLQLQARSDLLEEQFDPAIEIFDRLVAVGPVTAGLLLDDATAYFVRGQATGSENDRATALDYFRRADEMAPGDPVVLFNEALAMEDRGQLMNAVETWNRYLRFERDPLWLAEGRTRLAALEKKLNELKTHQSRMDQHLATPQAMRALAGDSAALGAVDEELSTTMLARLLNAAFPADSAAAPAATPDRSRGSPCPPAGALTGVLPGALTGTSSGTDSCLAARTLLHALALSLQTRHNDRWLASLLESTASSSSSVSPHLPQNRLYADVEPVQAIRQLALAVEGSAHGDYPAAADYAQRAASLFRAAHNPAGDQRARIEQADALQATGNYAGCYRTVHPLAGSNGDFAWIQAQAHALDAYCDPSPGSDTESNPAFLRAEALARDGHYVLTELRDRNMRGGAAADAGDAEAAWRDYLATVRQFYAGDFPALRLSGTLSGLEQVEQATPRTRLALLLQREHLQALELTPNQQLLPAARLNLAAVAIRAGSLDEAQQAMRAAQAELAANAGGKPVQSILAEVETALANAWLERGQAEAAGKLLDEAQAAMAGERNAVRLRNYAVARGQLALEKGHPEAAEPVLRAALVEQERLAGSGGQGQIAQAQQNRDLYAELAGVWLAQGRPGTDVLALWERYRLRILGLPIAPCGVKPLACLDSKVEAAVRQPNFGLLLGQIVLPDRVLLYRASAHGVQWAQVLARKEDVLAAAERLEHAADSPETPMDAEHRAARQVGGLLIDPVDSSPATGANQAAARLGLESDPLLGNLPWPAVATAGGDLGLIANLEESPSLLLERPLAAAPSAAGKAPPDDALVVGASVASGESQPLPEVLREAQAVARFDTAPSVLLGEQATEPQVVAHLANAAAIHFAGHAARQAGGTRLLLAAADRRHLLPGDSKDKPWLDSELLRNHPPRRAQLVVFSACSSGQKEPGWNHGMGDIVATLAALDVPEVVATRWQIDSAAAVPMMDAFYSGLARGRTVPQALTAARQSMARDPRTSHPYYWAAWYASGSGTGKLGPIFKSPN
jgi:CHAT domain-containing protein